MKTMNKTALVAAMAQYVSATAAAVETLRKAAVKAGFDTWEQVAPVALEWAAARHGCAVVEGQRKAKGQKVLDRADAAYEAAKTTLRRLREAFTGDADEEVKAGRSAKADYEIPAAIAAAAARLTALCAEYEGSKRLAAAAVAAAFKAK